MTRAMATPGTVTSTVYAPCPSGAAEMPPILYLYRIDPGRNSYRYYTLSVQPGLFAEWSLRRSWGRIGAKGCDKTTWFASKAQAEQFYERKRQEKLRRGYQVALSPIDPDSHLPAWGSQAEKGQTSRPSQPPPSDSRGAPGQQELFSQ